MGTHKEIRIVDLHSLGEERVPAAAALLVSAFAEDWPSAWPTMEKALLELQELMGEKRVCRVAILESGEPIGLIGGAAEYGGHAWELHPLVVDPAHQRQGIGSLLVADLEEIARASGATTIYLGTDDESGMTSLAGIDLFQDLFASLESIRNLRSHPFEFYQKCGYSIVGVIPDANGPGKPDILMAKRITAE
jgi:aminoglycoside 6'-N-acetyltransferase I